MRLVRRGVYRCTICEETIFTPTSDTWPEFMFAAAGDTIERRVMVRDKEVHRCLLPSPQSANVQPA
jgi:peptide methionine sulfoxide reductase MsrB